MNDIDVASAMELMAVPGEPGKEAAIAALVREKLIAMGVPAECITHDRACEKSEIGGDVGNLIVRLDGDGRGER